MNPAYALPRVEIPGVDQVQATEARRLITAAQARATLGALWVVTMRNMGKHVYMGTVTAKTKAERRAAGRMAKASRKVNR